MKMKVALLVALFSVSMISGCVFTSSGRLYPVQGPVAAMAPPLVFDATFKSNSKGSYVVSTVLANGESFQGKLLDFTEASVNSKTPGTAAGYPPQPNLSFAWDAVYGEGDFGAHLLGKSVLQATMTGSQGTLLQVGLISHRGVAVDNKGNIYKVVW
jgi:hypothetical protein